MNFTKNFKQMAVLAGLLVGMNFNVQALDDGGYGSDGSGAYFSDDGDVFLTVYDGGRGSVFYLDLGIDVLEFLSNPSSLGGGAGVVSDAGLGAWMSEPGADVSNMAYAFGGISSGCPATLQCGAGAAETAGQGDFGLLVSVGAGQMPTIPGNGNAETLQTMLASVQKAVAAANSGQSYDDSGSSQARWTSGNWGENAGGSVSFNTASGYNGTSFDPLTAIFFGLTFATDEITLDDHLAGISFILNLDNATSEASFGIQTAPVPVPAAFWMLVPALAWLARSRRLGA